MEETKSKSILNKRKLTGGTSKNRSVIDRTFDNVSVETIFSPINSWTNSEEFDIKFVMIIPRKVFQY